LPGTCKVNFGTVTVDQVEAKGVTIENGAQFSLAPVTNRKLTVSTVFTVINNTSRFPITGVFPNLVDDSMLIGGPN
jgi:hypothetical protein